MDRRRRRQPTDYSYQTASLIACSRPPAPTLTAPGRSTGRSPADRYDESNVGTAASAGPALQGLQASYDSVDDLSGYPTAVQNDPNIDSASNWNGVGPLALQGQAQNFSVPLNRRGQPDR